MYTRTQSHEPRAGAIEAPPQPLQLLQHCAHGPMSTAPPQDPTRSDEEIPKENEDAARCSDHSKVIIKPAIEARPGAAVRLQDSESGSPQSASHPHPHRVDPEAPQRRLHVASRLPLAPDLSCAPPPYARGQDLANVPFPEPPSSFFALNQLFPTPGRTGREGGEQLAAG